MIVINGGHCPINNKVSPFGGFGVGVWEEKRKLCPRMGGWEALGLFWSSRRFENDVNHNPAPFFRRLSPIEATMGLLGLPIFTHHLTLVLL